MRVCTYTHTACVCVSVSDSGDDKMHETRGFDLRLARLQRRRQSVALSVSAPGTTGELCGNGHQHVHELLDFFPLCLLELPGAKAISLSHARTQTHTYRRSHIWGTFQTYSQLTLSKFMSINILSETTEVGLMVQVSLPVDVCLNVCMFFFV